MISLTPRQAEILSFLKSYQMREGYPPTRTEICEHFRFRSPNAATDHLAALERRGAIKLVPGISRGIKLVEC